MRLTHLFSYVILVTLDNVTPSIASTYDLKGRLLKSNTKKDNKTKNSKEVKDVKETKSSKKMKSAKEGKVSKASKDEGEITIDFPMEYPTDEADDFNSFSYYNGTDDYYGYYYNETCRDNLSRSDCRKAKRGDYYYKDGRCHLYSEECKETCGCSYDPSDDRERNGLDDAFYESDDFQCVNGEEFKDVMKFNCTLYEGAKWCMVNESGDVVEGPGWCSWLHTQGNAHPCTVPDSVRWDKHESFNLNGRWAKSCCCNTGIAETYPYEGDGECVDYNQSGGKPWHDQNGYSCRAYHFGSFCTLDGAEGKGWKPEDGTIQSYEWKGMSALQACCTCGGGKTE